MLFRYIRRKNTGVNTRPIVFYALLFTCIPLSSTAQYRYDVGVKVSSYQLDRIQLDARYHLKSPLSLILAFSTGSETVRNRTTIPPVFPDSVFNFSGQFVRKSSHSIKFGVQRELDFLATDFFYGGLTLGIGYVEKRGHISSESYLIDSIVDHQIYSYPLSSSETFFRTQSLRTELALSFGVDVPITKRLLINGEIGLSTNLQTSLDNSESAFIYQQFYLSGGLRYSLGKRKEGDLSSR
ncbi:MAG: hypothetical protein AB8B56_20550 [Crocinitomicaceae bacterium]